MSYLLLQSDARRIPLADRSVHCVVTSPPYFGLRSYLRDDDPNKGREIGAESTPAEFVAAMVAACREVRRVLRDDGTFFLNVGDTFLNGKGMAHGTDPKQPHSRRFGLRSVDRPIPGLKNKDLILIPWMLASALRSDGWYLRQVIIWSKTNGMVESVTDRPTSAFEPVFLFAKRQSYAFDWFAEARPSKHGADIALPDGWRLMSRLRNVWTIPIRSYKGSHFATMAPALAERCIRLGAPEGGCCSACKTPRRRIVGRERFASRPGINTKCLAKSDGDLVTAAANGWNRPNVIGNRDPQRHVTAYRDEGWKPGCKCGTDDVSPCTVFDPFGGAGTTPLVAQLLGRNGIACDLNPEYLALAARRIERGLRPVSKLDPPPGYKPLPGQLSFLED